MHPLAPVSRILQLQSVQLDEVHVVVPIRCLRAVVLEVRLHTTPKVEDSLVLVERELLLLPDSIEHVLRGVSVLHQI